MCSYHHYLKGHSEAAHCTLSSFLRQRVGDQTRVAVWAGHVRQWLDTPSVAVVRFEDLTTQPEETIRRLGRSLGLEPRLAAPLLPRHRPHTLRYRLERLLRMRPESTAVHGRPKGHVLERWRDAFTDRDREFFHEQAGDVLVRLGYERSDDWVGGRAARPPG
jgi:hypothetical protein